MMDTSANRERWLLRAVDALRPAFAAAGAILPPEVRASCGWPSVGATRRQRKRIGECWFPEAAGDKHWHLFVSPAVADPIEILAVLVHELVHVHAGRQAGHGAPFARLAKRLGLRSPWTATVAGPEHTARLNGLAAGLGGYPHGALRAGTHRRKEGTRLLKVACPRCGYTVRVTRKWLELAGAPICPTDEVELEAADRPSFSRTVDSGARNPSAHKGEEPT